MILNSTHTEDKVLWKAFKHGDENAFTLLYQKYVRILYGYGKKLLNDEEAVEDMIQDLFIDLWQSRTKLADVESPKFYLFRSLRRRIHKSQTGNYPINQRWDFDDDRIHPVTFPKEYEIIEAESSKRQKDELDAWLKNLPVRQYEVLMLKFYQDFSYEEIAQILTINEQSVRNLIQRAVLKLRQLTISLFFTSLFLFF
ncbi:RNA polymerase sigma-70 factor, ECF subfamily [Dyadobacter koreensis]|uniref:RNA polymerase sigma-70 factor, ECF subfamily n=1 Tax=Dyadobacter koreensis TaxID=408657 RepID=A0A1H6TH68_9BACT|nr:sigma-70 family RNA polymerase sigma factor [Dyadobacter koreensis]SEI78636.1 RNA polymerase sigma-70 factor, ECF subfamily [Dyadobacter koreensis]